MSPRVTSTHRPFPLGIWAYVVAPIAFTLVWLALGFISDGYDLWDMHIAPYSSISQPISGLGMGATAPIMNSAFVLYGLAMLWGSVAFARSLTSLDVRGRRRVATLLGLHGLGAIVVGVFDLEAIMLHFGGFLLTVSPIVGFPLVGRQLRRSPRWRTAQRPFLAAGLLTLLLTVAYFATFDPEAAGQNTGISGLTQRLLVLHLGGWFAWLGLRARRAATRRPVASSIEQDESTARP
jgi:hypothetical membrane protein